MAEAYRHNRFSHELLVHDSDEELVERTREFVERGLDSGAEVLAHGNRDRVSLLRKALGTRPRLEYGFDEELYQKPMTTLFAYQRKLAERSSTTEVWVTGTVPLGHDLTEQAAWARYESLVNEALCAYPFRALCTYDTRNRPAEVMAAARASHPTVRQAAGCEPSVDFLRTTAFLAAPLARMPQPPGLEPSVVLIANGFEQLEALRRGVVAVARAASRLSPQALDEILVVVSELCANGLAYGAPPVLVTVWAEHDLVTCQVVDSGTHGPDPLTGLRHPGDTGPMGLWMVRQLVDDVVIGRSPEGGCSVTFTKS